MSTQHTFDFDKLILDVTTKCNLDCSVCYSGRRVPEDLPFAEILNLSKKLKNKIISICGGEPTLRADLSDIIRILNKRNTVFLITNGLRLEDYGYVKKLQESGLRNISFSFNGFTDTVYKKINNAPLLNIKLKALKNIKKLKIKTILSVLLVHGVNENQINGIFKYCMQNTDFIKEIRIRTMAEVGKFFPFDRYEVPKLLDVVCRNAGIDKDDIYNEINIKKEINELGRSVFVLGDCSFNFYLSRQGQTFIPICKYMDTRNISSPFFKKVAAPIMLYKAYGLKMSISSVLKIILHQRKPWVHGRNFLKIGLRVWPDSQEAPELKTCKTGYYYNKAIIPFCYANLLRCKKEEHMQIKL
jgi:uncharacterized radical SAM superfamily Fe-S cluster-containing enzyme